MKGALWVLDLKTKRSHRTVAVPKFVAEWLWEMQRDATSPWLFHGPDGLPIDPRVDHQWWEDLLKRAQVRDVPLHSARHTTASFAEALGISMQTRMAMMGHTSATTTAGYTHIDIEAQIAAASQIGELIQPANTLALPTLGPVPVSG